MEVLDWSKVEIKVLSTFDQNSLTALIKTGQANGNIRKPDFFGPVFEWYEPTSKTSGIRMIPVFICPVFRSPLYLDLGSGYMIRLTIWIIDIKSTIQIMIDHI